MKTLMISLDKRILDKESGVAKRMVDYGTNDSLTILIPSREKQDVVLSDTVRVLSTGGSKVVQLVRLFRLAAACLKKGTYDQITTQDPFFTGLVGWIRARRFRVPLELQVHGDFYGSRYFRSRGVKQFFLYLLSLFLLGRADQIRVVSERIKTSLLTRGIAADRIVLRPVTIAEFHLSHNASVAPVFPSAEKTFLLVGRMERIKNIPWFLSVFAQAVFEEGKPYGLVIVGEGSERFVIEKAIRKYALQDRVALMGWQDDLSAYYAQATALVVPSLSEGYSMVVMEARAAGCAVIMNDVGVAGYEVNAGNDVTILAINDRAAWKAALIDA